MRRLLCLGGEVVSEKEMAGLYVDANDLITGYCPACRHPEIKLRCYGIGGNGRYLVHKCEITCEHIDVCKFRNDYMEASE